VISKKTARTLVIAYLSLSLIVLLSARPAIFLLPGPVSFGLVCLLGPLGAIQYLGLSFERFLVPAMMLYAPATLVLGASLLLAQCKRRSLQVLGCALAIIVWSISDI
jgi:hypothetical protein